MKREISVVVPFHGACNRVIPCLAALGSQSVRDRLQIVLSVDGPEPPEEAAELADLTVTAPCREGPASARNRGWRAAEGRYILFTDADCIPEPFWAERMTAPLGKGWDGSKGVYIRGGGLLIQRLAQVEFEERYRIMGKARRVTIADTYSAGFTREVLERTGGFDPSFPIPDHEDVELSWRIVRDGGRIRFVPDAGVAHTHRSSWRAYFRMKIRRGAWRVRVLRGHPGMVLNDGYTPQMMKLQMALAPLLPLFLIAAPLEARALIFWLPVFLAVSLPLTGVAVRRDPAVAPLVPVFTWWRGMALASGFLLGMLKGEKFCSHR